MAGFLVPLALAATLAGTVTNSLNNLNAERKRKKLVAEQARVDREHREKARQRLLKTSKQVTGESAKDKLESRKAQNIASIAKTRSQTARPTKTGAGSFKGRISGKTTANRESANVATALRNATRNENLGAFLAQGNNRVDLGELVRRSGQDVRTIQNNRIGDFNARTAGIQGVVPNRGIQLLSNVLKGVGTVAGLASMAPTAASAANPVATNTGELFGPFMPQQTAVFPGVGAQQGFAAPQLLPPHLRF